MDNDFTRRGYLMPEGCKDLIDDWRYKHHPWPDEIPPVKGEVAIPARTSGFELAALLNCNPIEIFFDLVKLGAASKPTMPITRAPASLTGPLPYSILSQIARRYGFIARKADNPQNSI